MQERRETELASVCEELSELRKVYGKQLEGRIIQGLQDLNFLDVKFEIDFETTEHYTANGNDKICFYFHESGRTAATAGKSGIRR